MWFLMPQLQAYLLLGFKVDKPSKILIKILNEVEYIELNFKALRDQELMNLSSSMYEKIYLKVSLEGVLEVIHVSSL